jgi:hypothetical protein
VTMTLLYWWNHTYQMTLTPKGWSAIGFPMIAQWKKYQAVRKALCNVQAAANRVYVGCTSQQYPLNTFSEEVSPASVMGRLVSLQTAARKILREIETTKAVLRKTKTKPLPTLAKLKANMVADVLAGTPHQ